jgi:WD40 repeat protein
VVEMLPGRRPFDELEIQLMQIASRGDLNLQELLERDAYGLVRAARLALPEGGELLLVVDQFEELFTLAADPDETRRFLDSLVEAVIDEHSPVRVVITLRADFYDRPLMHPELAQLVQERTEVVVPLSAEELEHAIRKPAERVGARYEEGLVASIVGEVVEQPGALPLLQYALTELFEARDGRCLTHAGYEAIGGVAGALGKRAEELYLALETSQQTAAKQVFLRLVTLGEGVEDTRRRVLRSELETLTLDGGASTGQVGVVLNAFGKARLLSFDRDPLTRGPTVEVAHEALLREWSRLREWLDESRADLRLQRVLSNAAGDWDANGRDPSFLLRGSRLEQYAGWVATSSLALTETEHAYLSASQADEAARKAQREKLERRSRNFLRALVAVFAVAALVAGVLSIFAFDQQGIAQENAATAQAESLARATQQFIAESEADQRATQEAIAVNEADARATAEQQALQERDRAVEAENDARTQAGIGLAGMALNELHGRQPERAVPLALEAVENYPPTWQTRRALGMAVLNHKLDLLLHHTGVVMYMELSKDGNRLLTSSSDGAMHIWDTDTGVELVAVPVSIDFRAVWSPDDSKILIIADDNHDKYWIEVRDGLTGELLYSQDVDSDWFYGYVQPWSPDSSRFVTAHGDGSVRVWDAASGEEVFRLSGHEGRTIAEWSPDGDVILTNGLDDGMLTMFDAASGTPIYTIPVPTGGSSFRGWSRTGDRFIVRYFGEVRIYASDTGRELLKLKIPGVTSQYAAFSPDGSQLITSGMEDGVARLWDAQTGEIQGVISGLTQAQEIAWSPVGGKAAVCGLDGIHLWDTNTGIEYDHLFVSSCERIILSQDGERIFSSSSTSSDAGIYKFSRAIFSLPGIAGFEGLSGWSPDGQQVSTDFSDGMVRVYRVDTQELVFSLDSGKTLGGTAWSPSGDRILTWSQEGPTRIWDAKSGELLVESPYPNDTVFDAAWSPDGSQIAGSIWIGDVWQDNQFVIWDAATLEEKLSFSVKGYASNGSWSPDGKRIATTSFIGEASIRDAATGEVLLQLFPEDYDEQTMGITWTKDGRQVIVFSLGTGHRFDAETGEELMQYIGHNEVVSTVNISPDGQLLYTFSADGTARVFDLDSGVELLVYEIAGWVGGGLSPDGSQLLLASTTGEAAVYPVWQSLDELVAYAKDCCTQHTLTPQEREQFGLPPR